MIPPIGVCDVSIFRVGLSGEFWDSDGNPTYPGVDFSRLEAEPDLEVVRIESDEVATADELVDLDAFISFECLVPVEALGREPRLAMVSRGSDGYDDMDVEGLARLGVGYTNAPTAYDTAVGLVAYTLMLAVTSRLIERVDGARGGEEAWVASSYLFGNDPRGKTLGLLSFGEINKALIRFAAPLGMRVIAWNRTPRPEEMVALDCTAVDMDTLFREADVLSVCLPLNEETRHIVSAERMALMKPDAVILNTGRGGLIDEAALIAALREGRLGGAGLDVTTHEPIEDDNPLLTMPNVVVTPHSLCMTDRSYGDAAQEAIGAVLAVKRGEVPGNLVNTAVEDHPAWRTKLETFGSNVT